MGWRAKTLIWFWFGVRTLAVILVSDFQAEDGIRDLYMSRGLGDVYKRQGITPKIRMLYFCPNKQRSFERFLCLFSARVVSTRV